MGGRANSIDFQSNHKEGGGKNLEYLVYENRIGFPVRLNIVVEFDDLRSAVLFARAKAMSYIEKGMKVEAFNGSDWIWYAVDLADGSDKGVMLQIFLKSQEHTGEVLIPTVYEVSDAA